MSERRIGAYGGTFDPVHNGHIRIARAVARNFRLDELLMIPAHRPPHKNDKTISDAYHRFAMTALATLDEARIIVSTVELEAPERPYSYQTIERLREIYEEPARLFFVIGADSFEEINTWREPERLFRNASLVVITRPGYDLKSSHLSAVLKESVVDLRGSHLDDRAPDEPEGKSARRVYLTDYVNEDISSTEIRRRARKGESLAGLVPPCVADYIMKYQLYKW